MEQLVPTDQINFGTAPEKSNQVFVDKPIATELHGPLHGYVFVGDVRFVTHFHKSWPAPLWLLLPQKDRPYS